jgi:HD-like signal output (HDOD) protein
VGAIARKIVITEGLARADIEKAQLSGLLHDVGEMVIFQNWPKSYAAVDLDSRDDNERTLFGATHADISGFLCQTWDLDPVVVDSVSNHHQPSSSELPSKMSPLTAVHVARAALDAGFDPAGANLDLEHLEKIGMAGRVQAWFRLAAEVA